MINRLSNPITRNCSAAKILKVMSSNLSSLPASQLWVEPALELNTTKIVVDCFFTLQSFVGHPTVFKFANSQFPALRSVQDSCFCWSSTQNKLQLQYLQWIQISRDKVTSGIRTSFWNVSFLIQRWFWMRPLSLGCLAIEDWGKTTLTFAIVCHSGISLNITHIPKMTIAVWLDFSLVWFGEMCH